MMKIGDESTLAAFSENLRGASPDDVREFDITYPADYDRATLAGRTVRFKATVKALRRKELPELNDEFAKDLGDFQTLDEFKETVRKSIFREREHQAQEAAKHQILDKLVDTHEFPIPAAYLDRQIEMNIESQLRQLAGQGMDPSKLNLDWSKLKDAQAPRAARDVRASLLLDKISDREEISATQEEIDAEVGRIARQQRESVALVRGKLQKEGGIARIAGHIRTDKTLRLLFEQARKEAAAKV
jgi:trigger factor